MSRPYSVDDLATLNPSLISLAEAEASLGALQRALVLRAEASPEAVQARLANIEASIRAIRAENKVCDAERMALRVDLKSLERQVFGGYPAPSAPSEPLLSPPPQYADAASISGR